MDYFQNIIGQDYCVDVLLAQVSNKQVPHAYLFTGPAGCGKEACAKELAKAILNNQEFNDKIDNGTHPDVKVYEPEGISTYLSKQAF